MTSESGAIARSEESFTDGGGVEVFYTRWRPAKPKAAIQLAHGVGEHSGRYDHVGRALAAAGYDVWADDHRGHGRTGLGQHGGDHAKIGRLGPQGLRGAIRSLHDFTLLIEDGSPGVPLIYLGHSWGSLMGQVLLNEHVTDFDAVVFTGTAHRLPGKLNGGDLNARHKHLGTTGVEWLSRDPQVAADFIADPLTTTTPLLNLFGVVDALRLFGRPAKGLAALRDVPILLVVGSDDPLGGGPSARSLEADYRKRSGFRDVTTIVHQDARHEVLNEIDKDDVIAGIIGWLDARMPFANDPKPEE